MTFWAWIAGPAVLAALVVGGTGWWRRAFTLFAIRPSRMTCQRLGLLVDRSIDSTRVDAILRHFSGGFNAMITARSEAACRRACETVAPLFRPFTEEGVAMGYTLRHLFRYQPEEFERRVVKRAPAFRYLYYVGLGFWSGMRRHDGARLMRITERLDPVHRYLCFDGYGFKVAFFDHPKDPNAFRRLDELEGYARNAAYQGVGRALFFRFMARPDRLVEQMRWLGEHAADAAAGVGLASVFVNPDRLEIARALAWKMPSEWHDDVHLGMCFALKARSINDFEQFDRDLALVDRATRDAAYASVRECDRVELLVRAQRRDDGYRVWRRRVTEWMSRNIEYPLGRVRTAASEPYTPPAEAVTRSGGSDQAGRPRS